jgi:hypothetical protein
MARTSNSGIEVVPDPQAIVRTGSLVPKSILERRRLSDIPKQGPQPLSVAVKLEFMAVCHPELLVPCFEKGQTDGEDGPNNENARPAIQELARDPANLLGPEAGTTEDAKFCDDEEDSPVHTSDVDKEEDETDDMDIEAKEHDDLMDIEGSGPLPHCREDHRGSRYFTWGKAVGEEDCDVHSSEIECTCSGAGGPADMRDG